MVSEDESCTAELLFQSRNICGDEVVGGGGQSVKLFLILGQGKKKKKFNTMLEYFWGASPGSVDMQMK